jgi:hypothetical protein
MLNLYACTLDRAVLCICRYLSNHSCCLFFFLFFSLSLFLSLFFLGSLELEMSKYTDTGSSDLWDGPAVERLHFLRCFGLARIKDGRMGWEISSDEEYMVIEIESSP